MLVRMAPPCLALSSTLLLLAVAGSVSAQSPCLGSGKTLLYYSCLTYLTLASEPSPDPTCCSEVVSLTTDYGPGCLCQVIQFEQANPDSYESQSIIPGRLYNLNGDCSAHANMTNCSGSSPPPAGGTTPPASVTTPPGSGLGWTPPGVETPTLAGISPPAKGSKELLNAPCWCCQRRSEKTHPSLHPSHGGTDGVQHLASYPPPGYPPPYRAPYPVHFHSAARA